MSRDRINGFPIWEPIESRQFAEMIDKRLDGPPRSWYPTKPNQPNPCRQETHTHETTQPQPGSPDGANYKLAYAAHFPEPLQSLFTETPPPLPYLIPDSMAPAAQELMRITGGADRLAALALQAAKGGVVGWGRLTGRMWWTGTALRASHSLCAPEFG